MKPFLVRLAVWLLPAMIYCNCVQGQLASADTSGFYDMSLQELMNIQVSVASLKSETTLQTAGIVTLITEDEIKATGARDLMDVLRTVPGFNFGVDVEGVVSLIVRGNWAHEGKFLLLIDGQEMNENLFSTVQIGGHYPVNNIHQIEIIRGPGSVIYGGNAEYSVINIITKSAVDHKGAELTTGYGQMGNSFGRSVINASAGDQTKNFGYTINLFNEESKRSNQKYTDLWGHSFDMSGHSSIYNRSLNLSLNFGSFYFRGIIDHYRVDSKDNYDVITRRTYPVTFDTYIADLKYVYKINSHWELTPRINFKSQLPWNFNDEVLNDEVIPFDIASSRFTESVTLKGNVSKNISMVSGLEYFHDVARQKGGVNFVSNNQAILEYDNGAIFNEFELNSKIASLSLGARYNWNSRFDESFVPRVSLTKEYRRFNFKALFSFAYRAPNTENIDLNPQIKSEQTRVMEFEAGYKLNSNVFLQANVFDIQTEDPIIFFYDNISDQDMYVNSGSSGTQGFEAETKYKFKKGFVNLSYSFYTAFYKYRLPYYEVPDSRSALLGAPNHKISLVTGFEIKKDLTINPSLTLNSSKCAIDQMASSGELIYHEYAAEIIANLSISDQHLLFKGLSGSFGVFNILNQKEVYAQPYNGGHAPLPGAGREFYVTLNYKIPFHKF